MTTQSPVLAAAGTGQHFHFLDNLFTTKVASDQTDGRMTVMEWVGPKGFGPPLHRHDLEDELFFIIEGEIRFSCGEAEAVHTAGALAWLPRGLPHQFQILSDTARPSR